MKSTSFWDVAPFGVVDYRNFFKNAQAWSSGSKSKPSSKLAHSACILHGCLAYFLTLKMEAIYSSKLSRNFCEISQKTVLHKTMFVIFIMWHSFVGAWCMHHPVHNLWEVALLCEMCISTNTFLISQSFSTDCTIHACRMCHIVILLVTQAK
jgi:hypothetical protein